MTTKYVLKIGSDPNNPDFVFTSDETNLISMSAIFAVDVVGNELSIDEINAEVMYGETEVQLFLPSDYSSGYETTDGFLYGTNASALVSGDELQSLPYGTMVYVYKDNTLVAKNYIQNVNRIGKYRYEIRTMSPVGLLARKNHVGGLYGGVQDGTTVGALVADIIGTSFPYTIENDIASAYVFGWLPYATARENLHQILFAYGAALTKDANGDVHLAYIQNSSPTPIVTSDIYDNGRVNAEIPATSVEVTEHDYFETEDDKTVTLYDNSNGTSADHVLVLFDEAPVHSLNWTGAIPLHESGVNYAILSGVGVLTGKKYTHTTQVVRKSLTSDIDIEPNVKRVEKATLISILNANNVAQRLLSYFSTKRTVENSIVFTDQKCGGEYSFSNPYGESSVGFLTQMRLTMSEVAKADCDFDIDYVPVNAGTAYDNVVVLTGSGTWTVPDGITEITAILIGGGQGGTGGTGGTGGQSSFGSFDSPSSTGGNGGAGGSGGTGGAGGNILTITISPTGSIAYSCGVGGEGGAGGAGGAGGDGGYNDGDDGDEGVAGSLGTDTTFGGRSSSEGTPSQYGVQNLFDGKRYGQTGNTGPVGGNGGHGGQDETPGESVFWEGLTGLCGVPGTNDARYNHTAFGGGGGGGAIVGTGLNGTNGDLELNRNTGVLYAYGGDGGKGGNASQINQLLNYGTGGTGGPGGGGGGGGGGVVRRAQSGYTLDALGGRGGAGGSGGQGCKGADGCVIIYY